MHKITGRVQDIGRIRHTLVHQVFDVMVVTTSHDWRAISRDIPLLLVARRLCPRIVIQFHGSRSDRLIAPGHCVFKATSAWLLRLSDATLLISSEEQRQWQQFCQGGRFYVVSNPFQPADDLLSATGKPPWVLLHDKPVLLFVGRLMEAKGIFDLLNAMPRVLKRTGCHLVVVGGGADAQRVRECVEKLGLSNHVTLTGYLVGEQLAAAYQRGDVFVLPTYWKEGFPTVIAEAMSAGLPIVTTRMRGVADHLQEGVNALFVPPRDPTVLADTLVRLLANPVLRAQMSRTNREKVKDFAPEKVGRHYLDVLEQVVQRE
jgi:glycosyltransferase involved in cell wall biosynthesis